MSKINIKETLQKLLNQEDTDGDGKITVEDRDPKKLVLNKNGAEIEVCGTYHLSNLLEILILEKEKGAEFWDIDEKKLFKSPKEKISDQIKTLFWDGLTRRLDAQGLKDIFSDSKMEGDKNIIYVPERDQFAQKYYSGLQKELGFEMIVLPENITPEFVLSINDKPGILSLRLNEDKNGIAGEPFVVPGGRFNEMYGWDSYFQNKGLLIDGRFDLAKSVIENFEYEILYYGKVLNANRSYYLTRTQPPFFSSMILEFFQKSPQTLDWLAGKLSTCIKEYFSVWMEPGKRLTDIGLNRYFAEGIGLPWETESGHFSHILKGFAKKENMDLQDFERLYKQRKISVPQLDEFFRNDRSVRESGHDTTHRFGDYCTHVVPAELNCMLLKYEQDFALIISEYFGGEFIYKNQKLTTDFWITKAAKRKDLIEKYFWNEEHLLYSDYDFVNAKQTNYHSATCYFPLWVKIPDRDRALKMLKNLTECLADKGGILSLSFESGGIPNIKIEKQWDYPFGWAPHQMIIWDGLKNYGFIKEMKELSLNWLEMITENSMNYNGTITEKYDVVSASHKVFAEYGNQGTEFKYITKEGFGWMNASFKVALEIQNLYQ